MFARVLIGAPPAKAPEVIQWHCLEKDKINHCGRPKIKINQFSKRSKFRKDAQNIEGVFKFDSQVIPWK